MTTLAVNLIPKRVIVRRTQRGSMVLWAGVCAGAVCVGGLILAAPAARVHASDPGEDRQIAQLHAQQEAVRAEIATLKASITRASAALDGERVAGRRVDWVVLLGLLDRACEGRAVLREVNLTDDRQRGTKRVQIEGVAKTAAEAYEFVDVLRSTGVFVGMDLPDTRADPQTGGVSFRVGGELGKPQTGETP